MLSGTIVAIIIALFQWGFDSNHLTLIILIFIGGNILESNFLTPKLIGKKIGLHPVWLIFGLFVFGALFGFIGVVIAVPLTAICGTIIKHFAVEYRKRFTQEMDKKHSTKKLDPNARLVDFAHIEISEIDPKIRQKITENLNKAKVNLRKLKMLLQTK